MALASLGTLMLACSPFVSASRPEPVGRARPEVRTIQVTRAEITSLLIYPGELRPKATTVVTSHVAGRLGRLSVDPGSVVQEGDIIAELDRAAFEVQALQAQALLAGAEARLAGLRAGEDVEARAEADALLRAARARLSTLEAAPTPDSVITIAQTLRDARRRLAELEGDRPAARAQAETRLLRARGRLDEIAAVPAPVASPTTLMNPAVELARTELRGAELELTQARQPAPEAEVAAVRQEIADAEDALLLARTAAAPTDLDEARAHVEAAEARLRRADSLPSSAAIQAAESAVQYAWANVELSRLQLRESTIVASVGGVILELHHPQGANVAVGSAVATIQPQHYELHVAVEERQLSQARAGLGASVTVDAYPGESFSGTVRSVAPSVDPRTRTVATRIDVADPQAKLKAGLIGQVAIVGDRRSGALVVPREAIASGPEPSVMQVIDGRVRRVLVRLGMTDGRVVEVVQGLGEGMSIVALPTGIGDGDLVSER